MKITRIYKRVSTSKQNLTRQGVQLAKAAGKYSSRKADFKIHERIITLRQSGLTIEHTATLAGCSVSQVKRIWAIHQSRTQSD